jgi:hypothetical protein
MGWVKLEVRWKGSDRYSFRNRQEQTGTGTTGTGTGNARMERLGQALERECGQSIERTRVWVWVCVERGVGKRGMGVDG